MCVCVCVCVCVHARNTCHDPSRSAQLPPRQHLYLAVIKRAFTCVNVTMNLPEAVSWPAARLAGKLMHSAVVKRDQCIALFSLVACVRGVGAAACDRDACEAFFGLITVALFA